jgi:hypothetical protein
MRIIRVTSVIPADSAPNPPLPYYGIPQYSKKEVDSMNIVINEEIAPEVARALIALAALHGLSMNDYLCQALGL